MLMWAHKRLNEPKLFTRDVEFMVSEDFLITFYESFMIIFSRTITHRHGGDQFEPPGYRLQKVGWIYVVNHHALLHTCTKY